MRTSERQRNIIYGRIIVGIIAIIILSGCTETITRKTHSEIVEIYEVQYTIESDHEQVFFKCNSTINNGSIENVFDIQISVGDVIKLGWVEKLEKNMFSLNNRTYYVWELESLTFMEVK